MLIVRRDIKRIEVTSTFLAANLQISKWAGDWGQLICEERDGDWLSPSVDVIRPAPCVAFSVCR